MGPSFVSREAFPRNYPAGSWRDSDIWLLVHARSFRSPTVVEHLCTAGIDDESDAGDAGVTDSSEPR